MPDNSAAISYNKLRQTIGWLGLLLPLVLYFGTWWIGDCACLQDSISHYYYTVMGDVFVAVMVVLGMVLVFYPAYKEETKLDARLTLISGLCAICVPLFPTNANSNDTCQIFSIAFSGWRNGFHYACAGSMLLIFSYISIFIFTKSSISKSSADWKDNKNRWKRRRNYLYVVCGVLTLLSIITIGVLALLEVFNVPVNVSSKSTFWLEVTSLVPFGVSWLVKGELVLKDDK